jgi:hypothetical protein
LDPPPYDSSQLLKINPNYLENYPIFNESNERIRVSENEVDRVVLIPISRSAEAEAITAKLLEQARLDHASTQEEGESASVTTQLQAKTYFYKDDDPLFSFNDQVGAETSYMLKSPLIEVLTEQNMTDYERWDLAVNGINGVVKLPVSADAIENLNTELAATPVAANALQFDTIGNCIAEELARFREGFTVIALVCIALFVVGTLAGIFLVFLILLLRRKWLFVARLNGLKLIDRYRTELTIYGWMNILALLVTLVFSESLAVGSLLAAIVSIEFVIVVAVIRLLESRDLVSQLKGA